MSMGVYGQNARSLCRKLCPFLSVGGNLLPAWRSEEFSGAIKGHYKFRSFQFLSNVRVLVGLDKLFRKKRRYQGDLSASTNDALLAVNLNTVKLATLEGKKKQTAGETQVVILRRLIRRIQKSQRRVAAR